MQGEDEGEGEGGTKKERGKKGRKGKGERRKRERGKKEKGKRERETWPLFSKTSWTMEGTDVQTNNQGEAHYVLRYTAKRAEC